MLELTPGNGAPYNEGNPESPIRQVVFADRRGLITYLLLDDQARVDVLTITWFG
jgi:hypothetical protein